jgi:hypothetical protein
MEDCEAYGDDAVIAYVILADLLRVLAELIAASTNAFLG